MLFDDNATSLRRGNLCTEMHYYAISLVGAGCKLGRCIFASGLKEEGRPGWVFVDEAGGEVDFAVDNTPEGIFGVVLGDLVAGQRLAASMLAAEKRTTRTTKRFPSKTDTPARITYMYSTLVTVGANSGCSD